MDYGSSSMPAPTPTSPTSTAARRCTSVPNCSGPLRLPPPVRTLPARRRYSPSRAQARGCRLWEQDRAVRWRTTTGSSTERRASTTYSALESPRRLVEDSSACFRIHGAPATENGHLLLIYFSVLLILNFPKALHPWRGDPLHVHAGRGRSPSLCW
jgi:hypothetical protein